MMTLNWKSEKKPNKQIKSMNTKENKNTGGFVKGITFFIQWKKKSDIFRAN